MSSSDEAHAADLVAFNPDDTDDTDEGSVGERLPADATLCFAVRVSIAANNEVGDINPNTSREVATKASTVHSGPDSAVTVLLEIGRKEDSPCYGKIERAWSTPTQFLACCRSSQPLDHQRKHSTCFKL